MTGARLATEHRFGTFRGVVGSNAVVTGAAGGIGRALVQGLTEAGARVTAVDLNGDALVSAFGSRSDVSIVAGDVAASEFLGEIAEEMLSAGDPPTTWINNAGIFHVQSARELTMDQWDRTMDVNLRGVVLGSRAAAAGMWETGGSIINVASVGGFVARPNLAAYSVSKAAVAHLTRCLATEWGDRKIRVNTIAPGFIDTEMVSWMRDDPDQLRAVPLGRIGDVSEVVGPMLFLASDFASYITGSTLTVDGGVTCG